MSKTIICEYNSSSAVDSASESAIIFAFKPSVMSIWFSIKGWLVRTEIRFFLQIFRSIARLLYESLVSVPLTYPPLSMLSEELKS